LIQSLSVGHQSVHQERSSVFISVEVDGRNGKVKFEPATVRLFKRILVNVSVLLPVDEAISWGFLFHFQEKPMASLANPQLAIMAFATQAVRRTRHYVAAVNVRQEQCLHPRRF